MNVTTCLRWGLTTAMAHAGIMKATELHRELAKAGNAGLGCGVFAAGPRVAPTPRGAATPSEAPLGKESPGGH